MNGDIFLMVWDYGSTTFSREISKKVSFRYIGVCYSPMMHHIRHIFDTYTRSFHSGNYKTIISISSSSNYPIQHFFEIGQAANDESFPTAPLRCIDWNALTFTTPNPRRGASSWIIMKGVVERTHTCSKSITIVSQGIPRFGPMIDERSRSFPWITMESWDRYWKFHEMKGQKMDMNQGV